MTGAGLGSSGAGQDAGGADVLDDDVDISIKQGRLRVEPRAARRRGLAGDRGLPPELDQHPSQAGHGQVAILEVLHRGLGDDKYRPCPLLRKMVAAGQLGRKSGRGFYAYG